MPIRETSPASAVIGLQWGDEGKGKLVDWLADRHDAVVRFNGGANAGHSIVVDGKRVSVHLLPSGVLHDGVTSIIGNGVVIDPGQLFSEMDALAAEGFSFDRLQVSDRAHVVMAYHKVEDEIRERVLAGGSREPIGTTRRGIGPAYADKALRGSAIRVGDLVRPDLLRTRLEAARTFKQPLFEGFGERVDVDELFQTASAWGERLSPMIHDTAASIRDMIAGGKRVLFEGANATLLDVDHGTYPYVTSSACATTGICAGCGIPPRALAGAEFIGVAKAYCTRVGAGAFPTELNDEIGDRIREVGREYGTTTGRPRRIGWLDLVALKYSVELNGVSSIALTMLDVLSGLDTIRVCTGYNVDGQRRASFYPDAEMLERVEPVYEELEGFAEQIDGVRTRADLPPMALRFVERIESFVGVPISVIGVGPGREQTIVS